ncbi:DUF72 domain-containing protein [Dyella japonica]
MTGRVQVGTASWTDKTLISSKRFYPRGCSSAEDRLRYYASQFPMVEVDSSYYAMPSMRNSMLWAERTPKGFTFNVKAFRLLTGHQTEAKSLPPAIAKEVQGHFVSNRHIYYSDMPGELVDEMWRQFKGALQPLRDAGKLGAVHFQFPPWVVPTQAWYAHINECADRMAGWDISTEFRQERWFDGEHRAATLDFERQLVAAHVIVDMPQGFKNSLPQIWEVTTPHRAIVRLHGRNRATWNVKGATAASDRFNYDYSDQELGELASQIQLLRRQAELVQVVFNNNFEDQGQRNASTLQGMLL